MLLAPELDGGIGLIVQQALDPFELAFGVVPDAVGDLGVLALDDRPHASPLGVTPVSLEASDLRVSVAGRPSSSIRPADAQALRGGQRSRATAIADTARAPARIIASAEAPRVAPVVTTSSTRRIQRPAITSGS